MKTNLSDNNDFVMGGVKRLACRRKSGIQTQWVYLFNVGLLKTAFFYPKKGIYQYNTVYLYKDCILSDLNETGKYTS